jgi:6-phosphofructokinase 2
MDAIVTLTVNPAVDKYCQTERVVPEHKIRCSQVVRDPGGGGLNVSRVLHRLGGHSRAVYTYGGPTGQVLNRVLEQSDLHGDGLAVQDETRESLIVAETSSGQQYRFGMPGPELTSREQDELVQKLFSGQPQPKWLVSSGSLPPGVSDDFYRRIARQCRQQEVKHLVDTSGQALCEAIEEGVYLIKPNLRELQQLAGCDLAHEQDQESFIGELIEAGKVEIVLVSLGAAGALLMARDLKVRLRSPTVPIKSKVGAGDSMMGGVLYGLTNGYAMTDAARLGVAAGAAAVMSEGSQLCRKEDVWQLYDQVTATVE